MRHDAARSDELKRLLVVLSVRDTYERDIARGLGRYIRDHRLPWLGTTADHGPRLGSVLNTWPPDALVLRQYDLPLIERVRAMGAVVVRVGWPEQYEPVAVPRVTMDNVQAGRVAAEHLMARGLRRFGYSGIVDDVSAARRGGFEQAVREAGHACSVLEVERVTVPVWSMEQRIQEQMAWLRSLEPPVGVFAFNDMWASRLIIACERLGLRVPEDVAVLGTGDDDMVCELMQPSISSVQLDGKSVGYETARLIDGIWRGKAAPTSTMTVPIPAPFVTVRPSTEMYAYEDADVVRALRFIRENCHRPITVENVVDHVGVSRRSLETRFKKHVNRLPAAELRRARIQRAKQLLAQTDLKIGRIAMLCGFSRPELLSINFRRLIGMTAEQYRRDARRETRSSRREADGGGTPARE